MRTERADVAPTAHDSEPDLPAALLDVELMAPDPDLAPTPPAMVEPANPKPAPPPPRQRRRPAWGFVGHLIRRSPYADRPVAPQAPDRGLRLSRSRVQLALASVAGVAVLAALLALDTGRADWLDFIGTPAAFGPVFGWPIYTMFGVMLVMAFWPKRRNVDDEMRLFGWMMIANALGTGGWAMEMIAFAAMSAL